ncbi:MAG TPA: amidase family protein [Bacillales bacterium]|nr:amidase family protein [Bacillales bacterium]
MMIDKEWTIAEAQKAMTAGELKSHDLVLLFLKRIAALNKNGPKLNAVLEVNPDALHIAEALDAERKQSGPRSPLHGIPILLKDNISTGDHLHTSAGSLALASSYAPEDAFLVKKLREAGVVILGKTNLTEWANFMTENMPNGYSSRGGQVLNPYGPGKFDVGGSSSGSGSAVAANMAMVAVGTETSGSILSPAGENSIVGIKPTVGLISRTGVIPISHSQDTAGPMSRTVRDAALLLTAMVGQDEADPVTLASVGRSEGDYSRFLDAKGLKGARIGVARKGFLDELDSKRKDLMEKAIEKMEQEGAIIVDPVTIPTIEEEWDLNVLIHEFKADLNAYLSRLAPGIPHSLKEVIQFNLDHAETTLKYGQTLLLESEKTSGTLTETAYLESRLKDIRLSREEGIDTALAEHQLDALLFPANFGAGMPARAGYPSIIVPGGYTDEGQPLGITFTASAYSEPTLLRLAYAFEQATQHRQPPTF